MKFRSQKLLESVKRFDGFGKATVEHGFELDCGRTIPVFENEFWTSKQRAAHSLHEVSYRACFKPQLPKFFIERLTNEGDRVFDPFMGRGTTLIEAALLGRNFGGCDVNPLSRMLVEARFFVPELKAIEERLNELNLRSFVESDDPLLVFYHPETLSEINAVRSYLREKETLDPLDKWIRMVVTNRLTGHSKGFLSVYTMPPNQAVSVKSQIRINERRGQQPDYRSLITCVLKKSRSLLKDCTEAQRVDLSRAGTHSELILSSSDQLGAVADNSYQLVVTSPPFLDVINYQQDNWLRCWFNGLQADEVPIWQLRKLEEWTDAMQRTLRELHRILVPGGWIAFEVGEVRKGSVELEKIIANLSEAVGLHSVAIMINVQNFTKTSACWGVDNQTKGTNSNRIVLMQKPS